MFCAAIIVVTGALYFADRGMKMSDNSFRGFPAVWNAVVFCIFVFRPDMEVIVLSVVVLGVLTFTPVKFIHPVRTKLWRNLTLPVCIGWIAFAGWAAWTHFEQPRICTVGLMSCTIYLMLAGIVQQALGLAKAD